LYLQRRQAQTAADAGALAGARARCLGDAAWESIGDQSCLANTGALYPMGCDTVPITVAGSLGARSTATITVEPWLMGAFAALIGGGSSDVTVRALAEASCSTVIETGVLLPLTVPIEDFEEDGSYIVWNKEANEAGSFGWLEWPTVDPGCVQNHGNARLEDCIEHPWCSPYIAIGDWINTETGAKNSSYEHLWARWGCDTVAIPVYSRDNGKTGNNKEYQVGAFGAFYLTGMCKNKNESDSCPGYSAPTCGGGDRKITGVFVGYVEPDSIPGASDSTVYTVYLSK